MSKDKRFRIIKQKYPDYLIIFLNRNKFTSYSFDLNIIDFSKKNIEKVLIEKQVSYLIFDNLSLIKQKDFEINKYNYYFYKNNIIKIIIELGSFKC